MKGFKIILLVLVFVFISSVLCVSTLSAKEKGKVLPKHKTTQRK